MGLKDVGSRLEHAKTEFITREYAMTPYQYSLLSQTRRHFFGQCALGLGSLALTSLLGKDQALGAPAVNPLAPKKSHFPGKAKSVIYLFMAGGPSQLELFDHKPALQGLHGKPIPESFVKGKRFAFMDTLRQGTAQAARHPPQVRPARQVPDLGFRVLAAHRGHRR